MRYLWRGLLLLALGGLGWGGWYLAAHPELGMAHSSGAPPGVAVRAQSLTISGWQRRGSAAQKLWQITAHDITQGSDGRGQSFRQISDGILYHDGQPVARFTAGSGQGDQAQNTLSVRGGAHVRLEGDGTTLATEEVHWRGPQRQLWLPRPVHVTRGDLRLDGSNAHLDLQLGRLTSESVSGSSRQFGFHARHSLLRLKEHRLELYPVQLQLPVGQGHAKRVVFLADEGRLKAQEIQMKLTITPAARAAAATGLTLALLSASAAAPGPEKKTRAIDITGDTLSDTKEQTVVEHAVIVDRDTKFTADHVVVDKDAKGQAERIIATGKPRAWNDRDEVTGESMTVYPKERRVVVESKVRVVVRPKPGEAPPQDERDVRGQIQDGTITADRIEYDYRNKNVAATGNLKIVSRGRTLIGERAIYTDKIEQAEFFGPVHGRDEKGQTFETATGLKVDLKKGAEQLHVPGKFKATISVEDDEEPAAAGEAKKTAAAPSTPPAPDKTAPEPKKSP